MMHAWAKVIRGIVAHPDSRVHIVAAQRVVTFVGASHATKSAFVELYGILKITGGGLLSTNATRLTSTIQMVASVVRNEEVLQAMARQQDSVMSADVKRIIKDRAFWRALKGLQLLLEPVEQVGELSCRHAAELLCPCPTHTAEQNCCPSPLPALPYPQVVMAVQSRSATLTDVQRYWLHLAKRIKAMDGLVPPGWLRQ